MTQTPPRLWFYGLRHLLWLGVSTLVLVAYLFLVTLIDGWGSSFGNGLGGGIAIFLWALVPSLTVGRRFGITEGRGARPREAAAIALPATTLIAIFTIWAGLGLRPEDPAVRLSDVQFWVLHLAYIVTALVFFGGVIWLRARIEAQGLSRTHDQDTPPP